MSNFDRYPEFDGRFNLPSSAGDMLVPLVRAGDTSDCLSPQAAFGEPTEPSNLSWNRNFETDNIEAAPHASFRPESFEYGAAVVTIAANVLREDVNRLAASADPSVAIEIKTDPHGDNSPVTPYDKATEQLIGDLYGGTYVRVKGEEKVTSWPENETPTLDVHVDPIDGTELFVSYLEELFAWAQLPRNTRPPRPICGSMVSAGALRPGNNEPEWGVVAAPFIHEDGIVRWAVGTDRPAVRVEPDGSTHELPEAAALPAPETGGVVLVASDSTERIFGDSLHAAGYTVVKYKSAVAAALCAIDPGLFERLRPEGLGNDPIVGAVMHNPKNWDVAATVALASKLGHFVSDIRGEPRVFEDGATSAIFAVRQTIGRTLVQTVAPHLRST